MRLTMIVKEIMHALLISHVPTTRLIQVAEAKKFITKSTRT